MVYQALKMTDYVPSPLYAVWRDYFVLEAIKDSMEEAEKYAAYCRRNYLGPFTVRPILGEDLHRYSELVEDPEFGRALSLASKDTRLR